MLRLARRSFASSIKLPYKVPNMDVYVDLLKPSEIHESMSFLAERFANTESTTMFLKVPAEKYYEKLVNAQKVSMDPVLSMVARDSKGTLLGATMAHEFDLKGTKPKFVVPEELRPINTLLEELQEVYRKYCREKGYNGRVVRFSEGAAVTNMRGKSMFKYLKYVSYSIAKDLGFSRCMSEDYNIFSQKNDKDMGYDAICSIKYDDWEYKMPNGEKKKIFKGLDEFTTEMINKNRKTRKFETVAKEMVLVDGEVDKLLQKTIVSLGI